MKRLCLIGLVAALTVPGSAGAGCWEPVTEESELRFRGKQADAPVRARFEKFDAELCLDGDDGDAGRVRVTVRTDSVASAMPELTRELEGELFFHAGKWPTATFESSRVRRIGDNRFEAVGDLRIRDVTREVEVPFTFRIEEGTDTAHAQGEITIKRLDFNVGLGEWKNTDWVANEATVRFDARLRPVSD